MNSILSVHWDDSYLDLFCTNNQGSANNEPKIERFGAMHKLSNDSKGGDSSLLKKSKSILTTQWVINVPYEHRPKGK